MFHVERRLMPAAPPSPIRIAEPQDRAELVRMRTALWPDSTASEVETLLERPRQDYLVLVAPRSSGLCGFAEVGQRPYAGGCHSSPVAYLEGIWVDPDVRGSGVGRALVRAAEAWAVARGHTELASDTLIDNDPSIAFHRAIGFREIERIVCFRKVLREGRSPPAS